MKTKKVKRCSSCGLEITIKSKKTHTIICNCGVKNVVNKELLEKVKSKKKDAKN